MAFNESNTVEAFLTDLLASPRDVGFRNVAEEPPSRYLQKAERSLWHYRSPADIPRQPHELQGLRTRSAFSLIA